MAIKLNNSSAQLRKELKMLGDTLEELMQSTGEKSETEMEKLKEKAEEILKSSRDALCDTSDKIAEQAKEMADKADHYVHDKPWNGMGMAAAAGVVLGILLMRR